MGPAVDRPGGSGIETISAAMSVSWGLLPTSPAHLGLERAVWYPQLACRGESKYRCNAGARRGGRQDPWHCWNCAHKAGTQLHGPVA